MIKVRRCVEAALACLALAALASADESRLPDYAYQNQALAGIAMLATTKCESVEFNSDGLFSAIDALYARLEVDGISRAAASDRLETAASIDAIQKAVSDLLAEAGVSDVDDPDLCLAVQVGDRLPSELFSLISVD